MRYTHLLLSVVGDSLGELSDGWGERVGFKLLSTTTLAHRQVEWRYFHGSCLKVAELRHFGIFWHFWLFVRRPATGQPSTKCHKSKHDRKFMPYHVVESVLPCSWSRGGTPAWTWRRRPRSGTGSLSWRTRCRHRPWSERSDEGAGRGGKYQGCKDIFRDHVGCQFSQLFQGVKPWG